MRLGHHPQAVVWDARQAVGDIDRWDLLASRMLSSRVLGCFRQHNQH